MPAKDSRLCILHIDDSKFVRFPASVILRRYFGVRVVEANGGTEGLILAQQEKPDLIILDIQMPDLDGFATLTHLKQDEKTRQIPVLMCTAQTDAKEIDAATKLGAIGFLAKPIQEEVLIAKVREVLMSVGKWGAVVRVNHNPFFVPPDIKMDKNMMKSLPRSQPSLQADIRRCPHCRGALEYKHNLSAWHCPACRKYPDLEPK